MTTPIHSSLKIKVIILFCLMAFSLTSCTQVEPLPYAKGMIKALNTDKARYNLSEKVKLTIDLDPSVTRLQSLSLKLVYKQLEHQITQQVITVAKNDLSIDVEWIPPELDFTGYLVEVSLLENDMTLDQMNIAVDVSSSWEKFPRVGYLSDFSQRDATELAASITKLNRLHLNGFLFYDWQYRHDQPIPKNNIESDDFWLNIANEKVYPSTIEAYIKELHSRNMIASNYNLVYGTYEDFALSHTSLGLYKDNDQKNQDKHDLPETWASDLYIVNPDNLQWQQHFIQMEKETFERFQFDVMHLDTLGNRGTLYDALGKYIDMPTAFVHFTQNLKDGLRKEIVFNFVNEYAKHQIASSDLVSFSYCELWPDQFPTYTSLINAILKDQNYGLASVLALYMNYPMKAGYFNTAGVLLTEAVVLASGGSHLSMGDLGMLSSEYFPNNKLQMSDELETKMSAYADFMVAYENVLRGDLVLVNDGINSQGIKHDHQPTPLSLWLFSKEDSHYKTVHLVNLLNRSDLLWRDDQGSIKQPQIQNNIKLQIPYSSTIKGIYAASPDIKGGSLEELKYTYQDGMISLSVPQLDYWTMILIAK